MASGKKILIVDDEEDIRTYRGLSSAAFLLIYKRFGWCPVFDYGYPKTFWGSPVGGDVRQHSSMRGPGNMVS